MTNTYILVRLPSELDKRDQRDTISPIIKRTFYEVQKGGSSDCIFLFRGGLPQKRVFEKSFERKFGKGTVSSKRGNAKLKREV